MKGLMLNLADPAKKVFLEVQHRKAMPYREIAAVTGVRGERLRSALSSLLEKQLVTVLRPSETADDAKTIISVSGKYF